MKHIGILMEAITNPNQNLTMRCEISSKSTSELGAEKFGVSPATIERDAQYKRAVDAITSLGGVQIRTLLLSGEIELKKAELIALGKQVHLCPEAVALKLGIAPDLLEILTKRTLP
jgi:hypothetical protein